MRSFFIRLFALAHKETLHAVRDKQLIYVALGMPLLLILLFGYAISFDVTDAPIAVLDQDRSPASRRLVQRFDASDALRVVRHLERPEQIGKLLRRGEAKAVLLIPRGFARALARGEEGKLQLLVDGVDGTTARALLGAGGGLGQRETQHLLAQSLGTIEAPLVARVRTLFNPRMASALFIVPALVAVVLGVIAVLLSTITIAREWERGSMEQLFATPVERLAVILGKLLPYVALGLLQMLLVLAAGAWLFEVPMAGSFPLLLLTTSLFLVCVLGQGLLISTITRSQQVATQLGAISSILPALLLSGFLFPIANMPAPLRAISVVVPARYMVAAMRGILLSGRGAAELWPQLLGLSALAFALVAASVARFRRRLD